MEREYGVPGFTVDPISVDELDAVAKITGLAGLERSSLSHTLSMKAVAKRASKELGIAYEDARLIVVHLGGGGSVCAIGEGAWWTGTTATRRPFCRGAGRGLPSLKLLDYLEQRGLSFGEGVRLLSHEGGLFSHFGLRDITEMTAMSQDSPQKRAVLDAYVYQIAKGVSSFLPLFSGAVDAVVFTGGAVHSAAIRKALEEKLSFVGRLLWYPESSRWMRWQRGFGRLSWGGRSYGNTEGREGRGPAARRGALSSKQGNGCAMQENFGAFERCVRKAEALKKKMRVALVCPDEGWLVWRSARRPGGWRNLSPSAWSL